MKINLQNRTRRELADHIGEILGAIPRYLGVPTYNYQIGDCILERDGTLTISDNIDAMTLSQSSKGAWLGERRNRHRSFYNLCSEKYTFGRETDNA